VASENYSTFIRNFLAGWYAGKHTKPVRTLLFRIRNLEFNLFQNGVFLQIEPTTRCNLQCSNCTHQTVKRPSDLGVDTLRKILKQHRHVSWIRLQGLGEPFLCLNLGELCEIAQQHGHLTITTNGTCIDYDILPYLDSIIISLDSLDPEVNQKNKSPHYNTHTVIENIIKISELGRPDIRVNFVRTSLNYHEEQAIRDFCNLHNVKMDVTRVQNWFTPSHNDWAEMHAFVQKERDVFGEMPRRKDDCSWLKGKSYYYDVHGKRHICCVRMNADQTDLSPVGCTECPD
jgi:MoaA/NifB/PqqE/SkfB family radical SAM enzyme